MADTTPANQLPNNFKLNTNQEIFLLSFIVIVLAIATILVPSPKTAILPSNITDLTPAPTQLNNYWRLYTNDTFKVEFQVPTSWGNPETFPLSTRYEISFPSSSFSLSFGVYYNQDLGRELTFDEYLKTMSAGKPKPTNYTAGKLIGKKILYTSGKDRNEYILLFPIKASEIIAVNYQIDTASPSLTTRQENDINQILSTFRFTDTNQQVETIKAADTFPPKSLSGNEQQLIGNTVWPKLKPFKSTDNSREVYLVDCRVDNSPNGLTLNGHIATVPNTNNIIELTLKELMTRHYGGFPDQEEIKNYLQYSGSYKNTDSGINGVILKPDGTLIISFYDAVSAYGGGSSRVGCMGLSVDLTMKQFPSVKETLMCINKYGQKPIDCMMDFQP